MIFFWGSYLRPSEVGRTPQHGLVAGVPPSRPPLTVGQPLRSSEITPSPRLAPVRSRMSLGSDGLVRGCFRPSAGICLPPPSFRLSLWHHLEPYGFALRVAARDGVWRFLRRRRRWRGRPRAAGGSDAVAPRVAVHGGSWQFLRHGGGGPGRHEPVGLLGFTTSSCFNSIRGCGYCGPSL